MDTKSLKVGLLALCGLATVFARAQDAFGDDKHTFMLMPAEAVSSGFVNNIQISENSRFVVFTSSELKTPEAIVTGQNAAEPRWFCYDRQSRLTKRLALPSRSAILTILGDGHSAFFCSMATASDQGFVDLASGTIVKTQIEVDNIFYYGQRPSAPFLITQSEGVASIVRPNGTSLKIKMPTNVLLSAPLNSDANYAYFAAYRRIAPIEYGKVSYRLSDGDVSYRACSKEEWMAAVNQDSPPQSNYRTEIEGDATFVKLANLPSDLKTDLPIKGRLGLSNCNPLFSPDDSFVIYQDSGALLLREIKPVDAALVRKMVLAAQKARAISNAKQAALAMIMYAGDNDDVLPSAEGWDAKVSPYAKNKDLLKNFNYTFKGGNVADIENPASTELGFVLGPGGRAVAYTDGHVKWIPNP